jgi:hypothetical protein
MTQHTHEGKTAPAVETIPGQGLPLDDPRFHIDTTPLLVTPLTTTPVAPLYGGTVPPVVPPPPTPRTPPTGAEWLVQAKEAEAVIARGDHVSPELVEQLFLDAVPVIEGAMGGATEPAAEKKKGGSK